MRRLAILSFALLVTILCLVPSVRAQEISSFSIRTSSKGVAFLVDGKSYQDQATFLWPKASKHIVEFPAADDSFQYNTLRTTRYSLTGFSENTTLLAAGSSKVLTISADRDVTSLLISVRAEHQIFLNFYSGGPAGPSSCAAPGPIAPNELRTGLVYFDGNCYWNNATLWITEGPHTLNAFPFPGFVFIGWAAEVVPSNAFLREFSLVITGPMSLAPRFMPAKRVRFRTAPPGLRVLVDRSEVPTTEIEPCEPNNFLAPLPVPATIQPACVGEFDFLPGSTHTIGANSPQMDKFGTVWVFQSYSNGGANHSTYVAGTTIYPSDTLTAKFVRGVSATFATQPPGLRLKINDRDNWPSNQFVYAGGTVTKLEAPAEQTDFRGRKYVFKRWSNGGTAAQSVTIPDDPSKTFVVTAEYEVLSQLIVQANQLGPALQVDGVPCSIPCTIDRPAGAQVRLSAPQSAALSDVHRLDFGSWSDGGARERTVSVTGTEVSRLTVNYNISFRLQTALDPDTGGALRIEPASADGYYPENTFLTVTVQENQGFKFRRWDIDLAGSSRSVTLMMSKPRVFIARFDKVPFIASAGIRNAAGITPDGLVSPGSLVTIFGSELAPRFEIGPTSPLTQALAGVSLTVGNRILPLMFVSPEQINAQLPRDLEPGEYTLRVVRVAQAPIDGKFTVAAGAPGLFNYRQDEQDFAVAYHEDGTAVTVDKPAKRGERISVLGTGFGAYKIGLPEGFAPPAAPPFELAQPMSVQTGELTPATDWAGAVPGMVGTDVVRFRIPQETTNGSAVSLKVQTDGHDSNTVLVPVEPATAQ